MLESALRSDSTPEHQVEEIRFELERVYRIAHDYSLSEDALWAELERRLRDVTPAEFEAWLREGRFDARKIEGQRRFMRSSVSNLFFRYPELSRRRIPGTHSASYEGAVYRLCRKIREEASSTGSPYAAPVRFSAEMELQIAPRPNRESGKLRVWLPIPREYPFQYGFKLKKASHPVKAIAPEDSSIRSAYVEAAVRPGKKTRIRIIYEYRTSGVWFDLPASGATAGPGARPENRERWLREEEHVVFTPELRRLSEQIVGAETRPEAKAKRIYDWLSETIQYSFATEYSTVRNLSEFCRAKRYGDCGQQALLFITLCRLNGIPARWQSGWSTFPGAKTIHDWAEISLPEVGWVPVDPYMGVWATQYAQHLSAAQKREVKEFYFGGLDPYRMIANSAHSQELQPPKRSPRSDNVDFQRGELELNGHNIYFDQFEYDLSVRQIKGPSLK